MKSWCPIGTAPIMSMRVRICPKVLIVLLVPAALALRAPASFAQNTPEETADKLTTPAESFRKDERPMTIEPEEKPEISVEEEAAAPAVEEGPVFIINKIHLKGNQVFDDAQLAPFISPLEGKEGSLADIKSAALAITGHYRSHGLVTSRAYVPPQKIEQGEVTIHVLEGLVGEVYTEDNEYFDDAVYSSAMKALQGEVFRYQDLEAALYFLNREPDRKGRAYLIAGEKVGTSDIIIKVEETAPFHMSYGFHNRGTKSTHRARHEVRLVHNNLTGNGDALGLVASLAEQSAFDGMTLNYRYPVYWPETSFLLGASYVRNQLVKHLRSDRIEGVYMSLSPGLSHAFIKRPKTIFEGYVGLDLKDSKAEDDDQKTSFDRLRILRTGPRLELRHKDGATLMVSDFHWGIPNFLGASSESDPNASRPNAGGEFAYYTGSVSRVAFLSEAMILALRASGQWTWDNLPSPERFRAGGMYSVRGYPEGDSIGEYGYSYSAEMAILPTFLPDRWKVPFSKKRLKKALRFVMFMDGAETIVREATASGDVKRRTLRGAGFGVRVDLDPTLNFRCDLGFPLGDESTDKDQKQVHIALESGF